MRERTLPIRHWCTAPYVSEAVLKALGLEAWELSSKWPKINNVKLESDGQYWDKGVGMWRDFHFKGINLLGIDFLYMAQATFTVNLAWDFCELSRTSTSTITPVKEPGQEPERLDLEIQTIGELDALLKALKKKSLVACLRQDEIELVIEQSFGLGAEQL